MQDTPVKMPRGTKFILIFTAFLGLTCFFQKCTSTIPSDFSGVLQMEGTDEYVYIEADAADATAPFSSWTSSAAAVQPKPKFLPRPVGASSNRPGMINHRFICYMNSVVTSLFGAVPFRKLLYTLPPHSALMALLTETFAQLQTSTESVATSLTMMPVFQKTYDNWIYGDLQCSLEFAYLLMQSLGPQVDARLTFNGIRYSIVQTPETEAAYQAVVRGESNASDLIGFSARTIEEKDSFIQIAPSFKSVQAAFDAGFRDGEYSSRVEIDLISRIEAKSADSYPIDPKSELQNETPANRFDVLTMTNLPEMFVFGIKRITHNFENTGIRYNFYDERCEVNPVVVVKNNDGTVERYLLQSFTHYISAHYISYVCDYTENEGRGKWYQYNDTTVTSMETDTDLAMMWEIAATSATFLVYVRQDKIVHDAAELPQVPERYLRLAKLNQELYKIEQLNIEMARKKDAEKERLAAAASLKSRSTASQGRNAFFPAPSSSSNTANTLSTRSDLDRALPPLNLHYFGPETENRFNFDSRIHPLAYEPQSIDNFLLNDMDLTPLEQDQHTSFDASLFSQILGDDGDVPGSA